MNAKHRLLSLLLSLLLVLSPALTLTPPAAASGGAYADGQVLAGADSREHALSIAAAYGLELDSYAKGIAVLLAPDPEGAVRRSLRLNTAAGRGRYDAPKLALNRMYKISGYPDYAYTQAIVEGASPAVRVAAASERQWHHAELDSERAWELTRGEGALVAVIDTGVDIRHTAFAGRVSELSYNSQSDELGVDYVDDDLYHGTAVAGIIAARDDDYGVYGVSPQAELLVIKANEPGTGWFDMASLLRAVNYAAECGADIINLSLGRPYEAGGEDLEHEVIARAVAAGVTIVCAAGNDSETPVGYPAAYPEVIAVTATMQGGVFDGYYSNYGSDVDVAAPGTDIYTAAIGGGFLYAGGTSMAAPCVSGVAALVCSLSPGLTPEEIRAVLRGTAREAGALGRDDYYGSGIVSAYAAVLGEDALWTVTYDYNYPYRAPARAKTAPGIPVLRPLDPQRYGYLFTGWYTGSTVGSPYNFSAPVNRNVTLYARWIAIVPGMFVVEFPDPAFRAAVCALLDPEGERDIGPLDYMTDEDKAALAAVNRLDIDNRGIADLTGLRHFTSLQYLNCEGNRLASLDLRRVATLTYLRCGNNLLTSLDVSALTALTHLRCEYNRITSLDTSRLASLSMLYCTGNRIASLDLRRNAALTRLYCNNNYMDELDVSPVATLTELWCGENFLTELDISKNTRLKALWCDNGYLTELDISNNTELIVLWCGGNYLTKLDVSAHTNLRSLSCYSNLLTKLDVSALTELEGTDSAVLEGGGPEHEIRIQDTWYMSAGLSCTDNYIWELDVTRCAKLRMLYCESNNLTRLDLSANPRLMRLYCRYNYFAGRAAVSGLDALNFETLLFSPQYEGDPAMPGLYSASEWARDALQSAYLKRFIPVDLLYDYREDITRGEYCRLAAGFLEYYTGMDIDAILAERGLQREGAVFADTADPDIQAAYLLGIVSGTRAPSAEAPGLFEPGRPITREGAATLLRNTLRAAGLDVSNTADAGAADIAEAFPFARDGLNFCVNEGYMSGKSLTGLIIDPKGPCTREASILMFGNVGK
ncbi:MAG: S8 family serine peptidase [Oscillospiraceae bacterium]|jgi:uncharacterized repeat protein (TIGR02543 family)|nr:S8 family serine peptidase [Oscillospiraceae bacterium]